MSSRLFIYLYILLHLCSCSARYTRVSKLEDTNNYIAILANYNSKITQLKAALDIRGLGFLGHSFHERADILVTKPHYFLWSMRSFFDAPAQIIASNGEYITAYDFTSQNTERYQKMSLADRNMLELFGFRFNITALMHLLLAQVPLEHAHQIIISISNHIIKYNSYVLDNWYVESFFDIESKKLLSSVFSNKNYGLSYQVEYSEHLDRDGVWFPNVYTVKAVDNAQILRFELRLLHAELNGVVADPALFYLKSY
jgi:hypothetical protein